MHKLDWINFYNHADDPVLSHPAMRVQEGHKQLGQIAAIFPSAVHTRYDHSGFATLIAEHICATLDKKERLPVARSDIRQYTKIHDQGHPPFSHAVEYVLKSFTGMSHNDRALAVLDSDVVDEQGRTLACVLKQSGADIEVIRSMLNKEHPARSICSDKTLGADKLAYTLMDAEKCQFYQGPPDHDLILPYLNFYSECGLCVDLHSDANHIRPIDFVCSVQGFYFKMYTEVYLSDKSLAYERHIQRAVEHAIESGIFPAKDVWDLADDVVVKRILDSKRQGSGLAKEHMRCFTSKKPYRPAIAFKYDEYKNDYIEGEEVFTVDSGFAKSFLDNFEDPRRLTELEGMLEEEFAVPVLCCLLPDSEKVKPQDVHFYHQGECRTTLFEERPYHKRHLIETADAFFSIRLLVPQDHSYDAKRNAEGIQSYFRDVVQDLCKNNYK